MTEEMEMICFQVISAAGGAKSNYISSIMAAIMDLACLINSALWVPA